jgi:hypothetical protein
VILNEQKPKPEDFIKPDEEDSLLLSFTPYTIFDMDTGWDSLGMGYALSLRW